MEVSSATGRCGGQPVVLEALSFSTFFQRPTGGRQLCNNPPCPYLSCQISGPHRWSGAAKSAASQRAERRKRRAPRAAEDKIVICNVEHDE